MDREIEAWLNDWGCRYPWIAWRQLQEAEAVCARDDEQVRQAAPDGRHRANPRRMQVVEAATMSILAAGAAVEVQVLVVGMHAYWRVQQNPVLRARADDFARRFAKELETEFPLKAGGRFKAVSAWRLYKLAAAMSDGADPDPRWPADAYKLVAEQRNRLVHRTVEIADEANAMTLRVMEDLDPLDLVARARTSFTTMKQCLDCLHSTYQELSADDQTLTAVVDRVLSAR